MSDATAVQGALDLVLDIGKTHSKLLVIARDGTLVGEAHRASGQCAAGDWLALDAPGIAAWLEASLAALGPLRQSLSRAVVSAHGAAFAAVDEAGLCWPVPDYEFEGFDHRAADWAQQIGDFQHTLSPDLPRGLNAATQFDWLERHAPERFSRGTLLPWGQYWSWWLSGVAASEVSALGCHTHLWQPAQGQASELARRRGWFSRMAPLRRAWEVLGPVRPSLSARLGLPPQMQVHTGVHDSNACLARYLRSLPRMTLVTTGTWIVVMAPGAPERPLDPALDLLANVSVRNERVATGRFMGGRELQHLCGGADPALANARDLALLVQRGVMVLPGFEPQGGPFRRQAGRVVDGAGDVDLAHFSPAQRSTLAACYTAQVTAWLIERLGGLGPTVVEGPFAHNPVYTGVLAALVGREPLQVSTDVMEGTARGAWMLSRWTETGLAAPATEPAVALALPGLQALHQRWCCAVAPLVGLRD